MTRDARYDVLFEPITIGPKVMRNRFYQTPHEAGMGTQEPGSEAYFRGVKAEGGWAVVNTGHTQISPDFDFTGYLDLSRIWDEHDVRNYALIVDRIHDGGALAGIELAAIGSSVSGYESRIPSRSVSEVADDHWTGGSSFAMDKRDIRQLQLDYVEASRRARSAGFDIINIHGAEELSVCTRFLMRRYNQRTDEYGGSLENRARFWLETLERVREAVGDDCAIAARHCLETNRGAEGISIGEEGTGFIELADHLVDYWDVQVGDGPTDVLSSRFSEENFQGEWIKQVRPCTSKPIVGPGRFTSPDTMVSVIRSGQQDIIGCARPSISDPFLPAKIEEGRLDEIRECIGCNVCVSRVSVSSRVICTQNPTTGEEYRRGWHPERFVPSRSADQSVLIVGAGPAGLECAIVLARQGIEHIHLVEASRNVGGHFEWVPRLPGLAEWIRVVDYRKAIAEKCRNLAVVTNKRLTVEDVLDYGADRVIVATGSHWAQDGLNSLTQRPLPGADASLSHVYTPEQIMVEGKEVAGDHIVIYDCEGYFMGVSLAERIALEGKAVSYVTPLPSPGPYMGLTEESHRMIPRLYELGVSIYTDHAVDSVTPTGSSGHFRLDHGSPKEWEAEGIVLVTQRLPASAMYRDLVANPEALKESGISALFRIGDCVAPRPQVADAIFDGHRLAREIDSEDPSSPLPWIRENRAIATTDREFDEIVGDSAPIRVSSEIRLADIPGKAQSVVPTTANDSGYGSAT
jgi:dimethylamine/trimethylamine dehydrogenase